MMFGRFKKMILPITLVLWGVSSCSLSEGVGYGEACPDMIRIALDTGECMGGSVCWGCGPEDLELCEGYQYIFELDNKSCPADYPVCLGDTCFTKSCSSGQISCDNKCINPLESDYYCGANGKCSSLSSSSLDYRGEVCQQGYTCIEGVCRPNCPLGQVMCKKQCIDPLIDSEFCGVTKSCQSGKNCLELIQNAYDPECLNGDCIYQACRDGYGDCDEAENNGCETALMSSSEHCGECHFACLTGECINGECIE